MKTIYLSIEATLGGGGPNIFCYRLVQEASKYGYRFIYKNSQSADVALYMVNSERAIGSTQAKNFLRIGGVFGPNYCKKTNQEINEIMFNIWRKSMPYVKHIIFISAFSKNLFCNEVIQVEPSKYSIIHNGVDLNLFKPIDKTHDDFINLINVGHLRGKYFMESLIGVYKELKSRGNKVRLILVGSMDKDCFSLYTENKIDPNIKNIGSFQNEKLSEVYATGDIFLTPRIGGGGENAVIEAQACGLPVVCASYSGNGELIINGETGVVVESGQYDYGIEYNGKLADAVEKIIPNINDFKKKSREHALKNLSVEEMVSKYLKAMELS